MILILLFKTGVSSGRDFDAHLYEIADNFVGKPVNFMRTLYAIYETRVRRMFQVF